MKKIVPIRIESILLLVLFLSLLIPGSGFAGDGEPIKLPMPDGFVSALQEDGSPQYTTAEQIEKNIDSTVRSLRRSTGIRISNNLLSQVMIG